jgi:hypothetical protein
METVNLLTPLPKTDFYRNMTSCQLVRRWRHFNELSATIIRIFHVWSSWITMNMETEGSFETVANHSRRRNIQKTWNFINTTMSNCNLKLFFAQQTCHILQPCLRPVSTLWHTGNNKKTRGRLETPSYLRVFIFLLITFVSVLYMSLSIDQVRLSEFVFFFSCINLICCNCTLL